MAETRASLAFRAAIVMNKLKKFVAEAAGRM
jgi:hypothetical protein